MIASLRRTWEEVRQDRLLLAIGIASLVVLVPAAGWGIPHATSDVTVRGWEVDAISGIGVLSELSNLTSGGRDDWYVAYPLFHYLLLAATYIPYLAIAMATGALQAPGPLYPYGFADPVGAFVALNAIGHAVSVLMGCITVMAVAVFSRRLFGNVAGALAGAIALFSAPFVFYARTGNLDVPALCWTMLALIALERCWSDGLTVWRALAAGAFAAFAVATKDQSYGLLVPPIVMVLLRSLSRARAVAMWERVRLPLLLVGTGALVFAVAGGIVISPDRFVRHLDYITSFRETFTNVRNPTELTVMRDGSIAGRLALLGDFLRATGVAVGWPVVVVGLAGFGLLWRAVPALNLVLASLLGFFLFVIVPIEHMQYRYAVPPAVLVGIAAAGMVVRLPGRRWMQVTTGVVLVATAAAGAAEVTHAMLTDARRPASAWLGAHTAPGDTLGFFGRPHQLPHVPRGVAAVALHEGDARANLLAARPRWLVVAPDYFAAPGRERSIFLPADLYAALQNDSLGWRPVARFESRGLLGRPLPYLPYVNPIVQVYERSGQD